MKHRLTISLAIAAFAVTLGLVVLQADDQNGKSSDGDQSRIQRGFEVAPVPLNLAGKNRALVGLGSYLVNAVAGCNDCHTWPNYAPGGDPYLGQPKQVNAAGYLAGGRFFGPGPWGDIISRNITPDANGRPAGLTLREFINVIRTGADPDNPGHPLLVMPWSVYQDMTDRDLTAIYEYLTTIPSIP